MKFRYQKQIDFNNPNAPWTSRPIVKVRLASGDKHVTVLAHIDSGADMTLFHISIAETLGIVSFQHHGRVFGISGEAMPIHYHKLELKLDGAEDPVEVDAAFVDSPGVGALLGQSGFFEHYKICFERSKEEIEIRPAGDAKRGI